MGKTESSFDSLPSRVFPALAPRILSRRLHELKHAGIITRLDEKRKAPTLVSWILTEQGRDLLPAIIRLVAYTARWNNNYRFQGRMPSPLPNMKNADT